MISSTLKAITDSSSLKWIFVGGKGGVGKTSIACSLAVYLAQHRSHDVLLVSTDPAHNLSDALSFAVSSEPTLIEGIPNLYAMEIDPSKDESGPDPSTFGNMLPPDLLSSITDLGGAMPGMDETAALFELLRHLEDSRFPTVIFDTAPTGHTLKMLQFPQKMHQLASRGGFMSLVNSVMGMFGDSIADKTKSATDAFSSILPILKNPDLVTFIPVAIPEFLSLWETERLIQELLELEIDVRGIVVNQLIPGPETTALFSNPTLPSSASSCSFCKNRRKLQNKYLLQFMDLYEDFHLVGLPQFSSEIRGVTLLAGVGKMLVGEESSELQDILSESSTKEESDDVI
ncbi:hypothetical protein GEMRC1_001955 [Eukaryota sp. GEM-RC1]